MRASWWALSLVALVACAGSETDTPTDAAATDATESEESETPGCRGFGVDCSSTTWYEHTGDTAAR